MKVCEFCKENYLPSGGQETAQKYCGISCKDKAQYKRAKDAGHIRAKKSGYPRQVSIRLYMKARNSEISVPCHYCNTRLQPDNFEIDHKVPMSRGNFKTRGDIQREDNLVICCSSCNRAKGHIYSYEEFLARKQNAKV